VQAAKQIRQFDFIFLPSRPICQRGSASVGFIKGVGRLKPKQASIAAAAWWCSALHRAGLQLRKVTRKRAGQGLMGEAALGSDSSSVRLLGKILFSILNSFVPIHHLYHPLSTLSIVKLIYHFI
jgi:hypothetical protein